MLPRQLRLSQRFQSVRNAVRSVSQRDEKRKKEIQFLIEADSLLCTAEKSKTDLSVKIGKEQIEKIEKAESELRSILSSKDIEKIKTKSQELTKILQEVGTVVYQQAAAQQAQQAKTDQSEKTKEKVVDAEYEEVKENKKE